MPFCSANRRAMRTWLLVLATGLFALAAVVLTGPTSRASAAMLTGATSQTPAIVITCNPGFYQSGLGCSEAGPGSYAPGDNHVYPCPPGTYQPNPGSTGCINTPPGYYDPSGQANPIACPAGTFTSGPGSASCNPAPPGYYDPNPASTGPVACPPGTFTSSPGSGSCTPAPPGYFDPNPASTAPVACPAGTYQPNQGSTACNNTTPPGHYDPPGSAAPIACSPGTYQPNSGTASCIKASPGYYVATSGQTSQTPCPAGTFQPASGATSCATGQSGSVTAGGSINQVVSLSGLSGTITFPGVNPGATATATGAEAYTASSNDPLGYTLTLTPSGAGLSSTYGSIPNTALTVTETGVSPVQQLTFGAASGAMLTIAKTTGPSTDNYTENWALAVPSTATAASYSESFVYLVLGN